MIDTKTPAKETPDEAANNTSGKNEGEGTDSSTTNQDAPKFTQADVDRIAAKTREEERAKAKAAKDKEEKERLEAQAKEQGEHQKLAEQFEGELKELKPQLESAQAEVNKYKSAVADVVKAKLKALPEEIRDISPAQYAEDKTLTNPLEVFVWLPKGEALAGKLEGQTAKPGAGKDPKAVAGTPAQAFEHSRNTFLSSGKYGM